MNYNIDYFIRKFEEIPEEKWAIHTMLDNYGRRCANGWCYKIKEEALGLKKIFAALNLTNINGRIFVKESDHQLSVTAVYVNDGMINEYQQPTPKQRILVALYDLKKMEEQKSPEYKDITKSIAVLPVEEKSDLKKQLSEV